MLSFSINEISDLLTNNRSDIGLYSDIHYVSIDSRMITDPATTLFVAIIGKNSDGHSFIPKLIDNGVRNFIVNKNFTPPKSDKKYNLIYTKDTVEALQQISKSHRLKFQKPILSITGSNGKTITKEWLYQLLYKDIKISRSPKSYNSQIGVPLSLCMLDIESDLGIIEAGISQPGEMSSLQAIIKPNIGLITNIGLAHQENFKSLKQKAEEKLQLFKDCNHIIYCKDNPELEELIIKLIPKANRFSWSMKEDADLKIEKINYSGELASIRYSFKGNSHKVSVPFKDSASIENSVSCLAFCLQSDLLYSNVVSNFECLQSVDMRMDIKQGINNCTILNDSYNSDTHSLNIDLSLMSAQSENKKRIVILSDIIQQSTNLKKLYSEVHTMISGHKVDTFISIGKNIGKYSDIFNTLNHIHFETTSDLINSDILKEVENSFILLKGARQFQFERISSILEQKKHTSVLEINMSALRENINYFRSFLKGDTRLMAMVKAHSYGIGVVQAAKLHQSLNINYLAVAIVDEGVELRKNNIELPIVIMNPEEHGYNSIIDYNLQPNLYNFKVLKSFHKAVQQSGLNNYPIHIKVETGMNRLGFEYEEIDEVLNFLSEDNTLRVKSVFSHLSASGEKEHDTFTENQIFIFNQIKNKFNKSFDYKILYHILNSGGIERFSNYQYDMVRLGIGMYGISSVEHKLSNVATLKTIISQTKQVKKESSVGYSRKGRTNEDTKIGILPIGYADGLDRRCGNGNISFIVNGKQAKTIGNICMDMCMINLSGIDASEGDEVVIFGDNQRIDKLADNIGTIPYEILTSISQRIKRIYIHE